MKTLSPTSRQPSSSSPPRPTFSQTTTVAQRTCLVLSCVSQRTEAFSINLDDTGQIEREKP